MQKRGKRQSKLEKKEKGNLWLELTWKAWFLSLSKYNQDFLNRHVCI